MSLCIYKTETLCYTLETNTTLWMNYTKIKFTPFLKRHFKIEAGFWRKKKKQKNTGRLGCSEIWLLWEECPCLVFLKWFWFKPAITVQLASSVTFHSRVSWFGDNEVTQCTGHLTSEQVSVYTPPQCWPCWEKEMVALWVMSGKNRTDWGMSNYGPGTSPETWMNSLVSSCFIWKKWK